MSEPSSDSCGRTFRYTTIACEIIIFAFLGYIIGSAIWGPGGEVLGALIGTLFGTFMMFLTLFYLAEVFGSKSETSKT